MQGRLLDLSAEAMGRQGRRRMPGINADRWESWFCCPPLAGICVHRRSSAVKDVFVLWTVSECIDFDKQVEKGE